MHCCQRNANRSDDRLPVCAQVFASMLCAMHWGIWLFFAGWVAVMVTFVVLLLPETRGRDLETTYQACPEPSGLV